jgi:hypothetical protein
MTRRFGYARNMRFEPPRQSPYQWKPRTTKVLAIANGFRFSPMSLGPHIPAIKAGQRALRNCELGADSAYHQ